MILALVMPARAQQRQDSVIVSLVTCWPGPEIYELCGHEAIRVRGIYNGQPLDSIWNYGVFDFSQPNFIYRFVKGETDYKLASYPFQFFLPEYQEAGRKVMEQDLNLTQPEAIRLLGKLREEAKPENATYRYNYVKDNCATRILERLDQTMESQVVYPDSIHYGTFRNEMRAYHKNYPWYQFGIDLALGSGLDYPLRGRDEMFVPVEMMRKAANAHLADGRPLVRETRVLNEGTSEAVMGPTPWYATPIFCCWAFCVITLLICLWQWKKKKIFRWFYTAWFGMLGLAGCLIAFLVFISSHEATSPNLLLLWLNPLQLVVAICLWFGRKSRAAATAMIYVDIIVLTILLIVWPLQPQSANPAFFPLMLSTLALSATYAILISKISFKNKNNEEVSRLGAGRTGRVRRVGPNAVKPTKTRGRNRR